MTRLCEDISLPMPAAEAEQRIAAYFELHRHAGRSVRIPLHVNLGDFGVPMHLALQRDVDVRITRQRDAENLNEEFRIWWAPADNGPYPTFDGRLIVWSTGAECESFVEVSGDYEPPGGAAGAVFDEMVGHFIAERTLHDFLSALRSEILSVKETPHAFD